jgi:dolichol-phosphate mannosyltransferase
VKLSVVIPARDEVDSVATTLDEVTAALERGSIDHEILVVDDGSTDGTAAVLERIARADSRIRTLRSATSGGFGLAVRAGLDAFTGDAVAIMMADGSDDPADLVVYHRLLRDGYDCAFGSRFVQGASIVDYPRLKLVVNRVVNWGIRLAFRHGYNDTTNAFKAYRREVIEGVQPLLSNHFNLTVELPLKAAVRGYSFAVVPTSWRGRSGGRSKLDLQEMGSRYLFIVLYVLLERHLSRGDYRRSETSRQAGRSPRGRAQDAGASVRPEPAGAPRRS